MFNRLTDTQTYDPPKSGNNRANQVFLMWVEDTKLPMSYGKD